MLFSVYHCVITQYFYGFDGLTFVGHDPVSVWLCSMTLCLRFLGIELSQALLLLSSTSKVHFQYVALFICCFAGRFELESGRESVLEMLHLMFTKFPAKFISANADVVFVELSYRLMNEESETCRKLAALAMQSLLEKISDKEKDTLFAIVINWLDDKSVSPPCFTFHEQ